MFRAVLSFTGFEIESVLCMSFSIRSSLAVLESDCKVFDPGPRVQRVLTGSDCSVKSDAAALVEEKGEILSVVEDHDVECATLIKNPRRY